MQTDRAKRCSSTLRPRVLWVSESPRLHTGHGRVTDEISKRLAAGGKYEVGVLGWGAEPYLDGECTMFAPGPQPWLSARVNRVIEDFGPDVVVTSGPLLALGVMEEVSLRPFVSWVGYATFEASPVPVALRAVLRRMDRAVVPSAWCRSALVDERSPHESRKGSPVRVIPCAVDSQDFHPRPDRDDLRAAYGLAQKFVVGCVARNHFRKQIPVLLKAFARFAKRHREALLYLHMDPDGPVWRLPELVKQHRLERRVAFTRGLVGPVGTTTQTLNAIYNLFDVMVLPTMGEAFGLPILEAMAAGVPVIGTACSAVNELVEGRGELIAVRDWLTMNWDNAEYALPDADGLVEKLELLYADQELRLEYGRRGRAFAETMTWDRAAVAWKRLLDGVVSRSPRGYRAASAPWVSAVRRAAQ